MTDPGLRKIPAGTWVRARFPGETFVRVVIHCPACHREFSLGEHHAIDLTGQIWPSVICPFKGCPFAHHALLEGYERDLTPVEKTDGLPSVPPEALT